MDPFLWTIPHGVEEEKCMRLPWEGKVPRDQLQGIKQKNLREMHLKTRRKKKEKLILCNQQVRWHRKRQREKVGEFRVT